MSDKPGAVTAAIFWLKTRAGWREANQVEAARVNEFDHMTRDELRQMLRERLEILEGAPPRLKVIEAGKREARTFALKRAVTGDVRCRG